MNLQDIKTWVVSSDHKARPKNIVQYNRNDTFPSVEWFDFEYEAKDHVYHCSPSLVAGDYPAADVELVWQYEADAGVWHIASCSKASIGKEYNVRQYLQLKQPVKEQEIKPIYRDYNPLYELKSQFDNQMRHKENIKQYWLSCSESKAKWVEAIKEYFDSEHTESIRSFEDFKEQFDLD